MSIAQVRGTEVTIYGYHYEGHRLMLDCKVPEINRIVTYPADLCDVLIKKEDVE